ncbi:hypothetical protein WJX81_003814 [Elliptochloris bilobata]|uniref:FAD/NAD(P)-binding domain-containing protein n=1 Tax=Elliptochloris bilobata TaxID=381761 RepID=A0AAW1SHS6_9CHLO
MRCVVVGGGIAGVCCAEELCRLRPDYSVTLVSEDRTLKGVTNVVQLSQSVEEFDVVERDLTTLPQRNLRVVQARAAGLDLDARELRLQGGGGLPYDRLCLCVGATPRRLAEGPNVLVLRDCDSVASLAARLNTARQVALVGNGGIALELAHALRGVEVVWVVRHGQIGDSFFDLDAAEVEGARDEHGERYGHAVGPRWAHALPAGGPGGDAGGRLTLERDCEVVYLHTGSGCAQGTPVWPARLDLSNGRSYSVDLVISAIGVDARSAWLPLQLERCEDDGGILVDEELRTSVPGVWAAGDCCTVRAEAQAPLWFQMRLWTQARQMGLYAAQGLAGGGGMLGAGLTFELFSHATRFAGLKVVLLGLYNGQKLDAEPACDLISYSRATEGDQPTFVRVLLLRGRMVGAVLVGETELEETFENLILDRLDLSGFGPALLDPDVELDHVFD